MPYRPDREAEELAWRNAQRHGARASRPLVMDPAEARRQRLAEQDPFGLDDDEAPTSPWIDEGLWDIATIGPFPTGPILQFTVQIVLDQTAFRDAVDRALQSLLGLRQASIGLTGIHGFSIAGWADPLPEPNEVADVPALDPEDQYAQVDVVAIMRDARASQPERRGRLARRICPRHGHEWRASCSRCADARQPSR